MAQATRTPTPNSMVILSGNNEDPSYKPKRVSSGKKHKLKQETVSTSLEILPPEDKENDHRRGASTPSKKSSRPMSGRPGSGSRPGSSATRAPPVRDSPTRRPATPGTPTRQVSLQTVKRKEEKELDLGPLDWKPSTDVPSQQLPGQVDRLTLDDSSTRHKGNSGVKKGVEDLNIGDSDEFDTDLEDGGEENSEEEEEEKPKAPTELMLEFLDTVYKKEWNTARNLCKMILIYEPENAEASKFAPLIEEKLQLDAEESSEEETDDSDESDSDDDSDDSGDEGASSQESTDEEYNAEDEAEGPEMTKKDSAIGLSSCSKNYPT